MKIGDLVRVKDNINYLVGDELRDRVGIVCDLSDPSPSFPHILVTVEFYDGKKDGILSRHLEILTK